MGEETKLKRENPMSPAKRQFVAAAASAAGAAERKENSRSSGSDDDEEEKEEEKKPSRLTRSSTATWSAGTKKRGVSPAKTSVAEGKKKRGVSPATAKRPPRQKEEEEERRAANRTSKSNAAPIPPTLISDEDVAFTTQLLVRAYTVADFGKKPDVGLDAWSNGGRQMVVIRSAFELLNFNNSAALFPDKSNIKGISTARGLEPRGSFSAQQLVTELCQAREEPFTLVCPDSQVTAQQLACVFGEGLGKDAAVVSRLNPFSGASVEDGFDLSLGGMWISDGATPLHIDGYDNREGAKEVDWTSEGRADLVERFESSLSRDQPSNLKNRKIKSPGGHDLKLIRMDAVVALLGATNKVHS